VLLGQEPLAHAILLESKPRQVCNALIISKPGHPFWLEVVRHATKRAGPWLAYSEPVGTTGPRMLEHVVLQWERARHDLEARYLKVLPPAVFYPTWDPMATNILRERCSPGKGSWQRRSPNLLAVESARACSQLREQGFTPSVPSDGRSYTNHLWVHTWINGASKVDLTDTVSADVQTGHT